MRNCRAVWIVDDDPIFQFYMKRLISKMVSGVTIRTFWNGEEANNAIQSIQSLGSLPNLIFLDLNMPVMDGWHFLDKLKVLPQADDIAVYLTTSSIDPADIEAASRRKRVKDYLVKPIKAEDIQHVVSKYFLKKSEGEP